jgi:hypothetical protein
VIVAILVFSTAEFRMMNSREKPESARTTIFTPSNRSGIAATIFSKASTVPSLASALFLRNCAQRGTEPQKQYNGR